MNSTSLCLHDSGFGQERRQDSMPQAPKSIFLWRQMQSARKSASCLPPSLWCFIVFGLWYSNLWYGVVPRFSDRCIGGVAGTAISSELIFESCLKVDVKARLQITFRSLILHIVVPRFMMKRIDCCWLWIKIGKIYFSFSSIVQSNEIKKFCILSLLFTVEDFLYYYWSPVNIISKITVYMCHRTAQYSTRKISAMTWSGDSEFVQNR